jgi:hypothetical protein
MKIFHSGSFLLGAEVLLNKYNYLAKFITTILNSTNMFRTLTHHLWKPTFAKKIISINDYGFPLGGYGSPLQDNEFPLHGNVWQNLKICF